MFVSLNQKNSNMENVKEQSNSPIVAFDLGSKNSVVVSDGKVVVDVLTKNFADIMNIEFTAEMENKLDSIEEGKQNWQALVGSKNLTRQQNNALSNAASYLP